jgi:hypothetical protein
VWRTSELFTRLREPQTGGACTSCSAYDSCQGGCMAAKFFTGLPMDGPDPECVKGNGEKALAMAGVGGDKPKPDKDHSHRTKPRPKPVTVGIGWGPPEEDRLPDRACDTSPLAGFRP